MNKQQIKQILDGAPEGADEFFIYQGCANYIDNHENGHQFKIWCDDNREWVFSELVDEWEYIRDRHALSDLRAQLELIEENESLVECVTVLLKLHDNKVFTKEPWEETFNKLRKVLNND